MSKIGKLPISLKEGVKVETEGSTVTVTGPKGNLVMKTPREVEVVIENNEVIVKPKKTSIAANALHGTVRSLIANMVQGVTEGWTRQLELVGTGYRAEVKGSDLVLTVGYSHPITVTAPEGISYKVEKNVVTVSGIDKIVVGQTAADIRNVRPPEPYKGKGIKYVGEVVRRKAGKAAKAGA